MQKVSLELNRSRERGRYNYFKYLKPFFEKYEKQLEEGEENGRNTT